MPLQSSGPISISEIKTELTSSSNSLRTLSAAAGFSSPDSMSEFYSYSFITALPPTVSTSGASGVTNTQIIANGNVTDDGDATITERGFYFGTSTNRASNPKYVVSGTTGGFSLTRTGLSTSTTYRFWAYATNSQGTTYGAMQTAATYPTMNYSVGSSVYLGYDLYAQVQAFPNTGSATPYVTGRNYSALKHPYLGHVTLEQNDATFTNAGDYWVQSHWKYATKSGSWGSTLCKTEMMSQLIVPYDHYLYNPVGQWLAYFQWPQSFRYDVSNAGFAQNGDSGYYVSGARTVYNYFASQSVRVYGNTSYSPLVYDMGVYINVYK